MTNTPATVDKQSVRPEQEETEVIIRPLDLHQESQPRNLVLQTWIRGANNTIGIGYDPMEYVPDALRYGVVQRHTETLIDRGAQALIACNSSDLDQIFGYLVYSVGGEHRYILHWLYVKSMFRRMGVATALVKELGIDVKGRLEITHFSPQMSQVARKLRLDLVHRVDLLE